VGQDRPIKLQREEEEEEEEVVVVVEEEEEEEEEVKKKKPFSGKHKIIGYKTQPQLRVYRTQKTKQKLAFKGQETYSFVDGKTADKVTFNYIVHIGLEGRYLGMTGREEQGGS